MALTPVTLRSAELPRSLRGYDVEATRELLELAADELKLAVSQRDRLAEEVHRLEAELAGRQDEGGVSDKERLVSDALLAAARAAEDLREQGRRDGEAAVTDAEARAKEILADAEEEGGHRKEEADKQGEAVLEQAKADARAIHEAVEETSAKLRSVLADTLEKLDTQAEGAPQGEASSPKLLDELQPRTRL